MCEVRGLDQKSWAQTLQKQGSLFSGPWQRAPWQEGLGDVYTEEYIELTKEYYLKM